MHPHIIADSITKADDDFKYAEDEDIKIYHKGDLKDFPINLLDQNSNKLSNDYPL